MKNLDSFKNIFLHRAIVDGRKQINGLAALVESEMKHNPFEGSLYVFTTRRRDFIKLLYWDKCGFALWVKRLEKEKLRWPLKMPDDVIDLTSQQLNWLIDGYDIMRMKPHATLAFKAVS